MHRGGRGRQAHVRGDLVHGDDPVAEVAQDRDPGVVGKRAEDHGRMPFAGRPVHADALSRRKAKFRVHLSASLVCVTNGYKRLFGLTRLVPCE